MLNITYYRDNRCKLDKSHRYYSLIRSHFSYNDPDAKFSKNDNIPSRKYTITSAGYLQIGMLWDVIRAIKDNNWDVTLNISPAVKARMINPININLLEVPNTSLKLRDYQLAALKAALKVGNGIIEVGTGGGKSLILADMMESLYQADNNVKILLVVPDTGLLSQMDNDFKEYGCNFTTSKWSGTHELNKDVNVLITHTKYLQTFNKKESISTINYFNTMDYLFYDEVHLFYNKKTPKATAILKKVDFPNKFGCTGSMHKESYLRDRIVGYFGQVIYIKSSKELRDEGYLSNVEVKMVSFQHSMPYSLYPQYITDAKTGELRKHSKGDWYNIELDFIINWEFRNNYIKRLLKKLNGNSLILVERIRHGEILQELLSDISGRKVYFIQGATTVADRDKIKQLMEDNDNIICIAMSKIFSTGISIKNIPYIVFAYLGKGWHKVIQSVGRGLRKHENKVKLIIFDLCDNLKYSRRHADSRKETYNDQQIEWTIYNINE